MRYPHEQTGTTTRCRSHHHAGAEVAELELSWQIPGEHVHAEIEAHAWRYLALDVPYEHRTILFGGTVGWICSGIASAIGNRRTRQAAERLAASQWRYLGHLPIIVTDHRLLVWYQDQWNDVWLNAIETVATNGDRVELHFNGDPPYLLSTPEAEMLGAAVSASTGPAPPL